MLFFVTLLYKIVVYLYIQQRNNNITNKVTTMKAITSINVNNKSNNVIDIDFSDLTTINGGTAIVGTIGIETVSGWKFITGEHGLYDYVNDFGFIIVVNA